MKKTVLFFAFLPVIAQAQVHGTVLNDLMKKSSVGVLEASAAMVIAQALGLDPQAVIRETRPYGVTVYESGPAWYISHECHRPIADVWREKHNGKGWGVIAHEMGMNPGTFNKMRKSGAFDHNCWVEMTHRYNVNDSDWSRYRGRGYSDRDILIASAIGNGDRHRFVTEFDSRSKTGYWNVPGHGRVKAGDVGNRNSGHGGGDKGSGKGNSGHGNSGKGIGKSNHGNGGGKSKLKSESGHGNSGNHGKGKGVQSTEKHGNGQGKGNHGNGGQGKGNGKGKGKGG